MAKIWHKRILAGTQFYAECPLKYKADVKNMFLEDVVNGVITIEQYEEYVGESYPIVEEMEFDESEE